MIYDFRRCKRGPVWASSVEEGEAGLSSIIIWENKDHLYLKNKAKYFRLHLSDNVRREKDLRMNDL